MTTSDSNRGGNPAFSASEDNIFELRQELCKGRLVLRTHLNPAAYCHLTQRKWSTETEKKRVCNLTQSGGFQKYRFPAITPRFSPQKAYLLLLHTVI